LQVPRVIKILREAGARIGVVFHDAQPYPGNRPIDHVRRFVQVRTMRQALRGSERAIVTVPADKLPWTLANLEKVIFIPVGANLSHTPSGAESDLGQNEALTVAVFSVTGGLAEQREVSQITAAVRFAAAKLGKIRLLVFGRNADSAQGALLAGLRGLDVALHVAGVLPENEIERLLRSADVLLFVRGSISSRRGSAIAGIACGLPVIAFAGSETAPPITDAGVVLVAGGNKAALGEALVRVLGDREYHARLVERSRIAYKNHFSWESIAARYASVLKAPSERKER
jgi:glycosyltransferase involved in cell wall biosynthesis